MPLPLQLLRLRCRRFRWIFTVCFLERKTKLWIPWRSRPWEKFSDYIKSTKKNTSFFFWVEFSVTLGQDQIEEAFEDVMWCLVSYLQMDEKTIKRMVIFRMARRSEWDVIAKTANEGVASVILSCLCFFRSFLLAWRGARNHGRVAGRHRHLRCLGVPGPCRFSRVMVTQCENGDRKRHSVPHSRCFVWDGLFEILGWKKTFLFCVFFLRNVKAHLYRERLVIVGVELELRTAITMSSRRRTNAFVSPSRRGTPFAKLERDQISFEFSKKTTKHSESQTKRHFVINYGTPRNSFSALRWRLMSWMGSWYCWPFVTRFEMEALEAFIFVTCVDLKVNMRNYVVKICEQNIWNSKNNKKTWTMWTHSCTAELDWMQVVFARARILPRLCHPVNARIRSRWETMLGRWKNDALGFTQFHDSWCRLLFWCLLWLFSLGFLT